MVASSFIAARVSPETKVRLKALAAQRHVSESALLKDLLDLALGSSNPSAFDPDGPVTRAPRAARLYVRLRPDDHLLLAERAAARRLAAASYVAALVRAHLRHLAPLPLAELQSLNRAVAELGAIGRNLNQLARAAQSVEPKVGPRTVDVLAMLRVCEALRDHVKALLKANALSWRVGYAEPNP